jgi:hypothetical protein
VRINNSLFTNHYSLIGVPVARLRSSVVNRLQHQAVKQAAVCLQEGAMCAGVHIGCKDNTEVAEFYRLVQNCYWLLVAGCWLGQNCHPDGSQDLHTHTHTNTHTQLGDSGIRRNDSSSLTSNQQPVTSNQQPKLTSNQQPATSNIFPIFPPLNKLLKQYEKINLPSFRYFPDVQHISEG